MPGPPFLLNAIATQTAAICSLPVRTQRRRRLVVVLLRSGRAVVRVTKLSPDLIESRHAAGVIKFAPTRKRLFAFIPDLIVVGSMPAVLAVRDSVPTMPVVMSAITRDRADVPYRKKRPRSGPFPGMRNLE